MNVTIWHNEACSKSNAALTYLENKNLNIRIINYLENTPSILEIENFLKLSGMKAKDLFRSTEALYEELKIFSILDEKELISILNANATLIQRPVIITENAAVLARPFEKLSDLI